MAPRTRSSFNARQFGNHIQQLRRVRGLTQECLAERCELASDTIRRLEHGSFSPSLDTLVKLCDGLRLSIVTLFEGYELCESDRSSEIVDLVRTRTPRERAVALRILRAVFESMDAEADGDDG